LVPNSRKTFVQWCLRELGYPVIRINVSAEQIDDRVDYALKKYQEFHYDATEKLYFKHILQENEWPDRVHTVDIVSGNCSNSSSKYANGDALVFTSGGDNPSNTAAGSISTDANGNIISITLTDYGKGYNVSPTVTVDSVSGNGAVLKAQLGGYIDIPEDIIGIIEMFDISSMLMPQDMFSIQYQIALNDLWQLSTYSMVPYYLVMSQLSLIQQLLIGSQPIRFTRHRTRAFLDGIWNKMKPGDYIVLTVYQAINPNEFPLVWSDIWLQTYATALIKRQWGNNMKKFTNLQGPGGVILSGQQIYNEAVSEIKDLEDSLIRDFSIPPGFEQG
jgi:hypothetical protein